jgi:threonine dehydrogenase-like Zn-dependent dehydrogenase
LRANCWIGPNDVRVELVPDPKILNARDAMVRITATAICGSDLHLYNGFMPTMHSGDILGHEFMGEVAEVGPGVKNLKVGDRGVVPFPISCGSCKTCKAWGIIGRATTAGAADYPGMEADQRPARRASE